MGLSDVILGSAKAGVPLESQKDPPYLLSADCRHCSLDCGRPFHTFNIVDDFNHEDLRIKLVLNLPTQRVVCVLNRLAANRG